VKERRKLERFTFFQAPADRPYRDVHYDTRSALELICKEASLGKLRWNIVKLLIAYNRRDKPFMASVSFQRKKEAGHQRGIGTA